MNPDRLGRPNPLVGRPIFYMYRVELSLSRDQLLELDQMASAKNQTRAELIRTYITWGLEVDSKEKR